MNWKCLVWPIVWWVVLGMGMPLLALPLYDLRNPSEAYWSIFVNLKYMSMMVVLLSWLIYVHISAQQEGEESE